jgi:hypothetical protein
MTRKISLLILVALLSGVLAGCCATRPSRTHGQQQQSAKEAQKELDKQ